MEGAMERATATTTATNGAAKPSSGETTRPLDKYFPKNLTSCGFIGNFSDVYSYNSFLCPSVPLSLI